MASYLVDLPVAEPNPAMRLHQVSFAMAAHTETGHPGRRRLDLELGRFAPPTLHALGARVAGQLSRRMYNVLVTNVPGPQIPLVRGGFQVVAMYPVAPLAKGHTLAVACTSYNGRVFFGLTADRDAMPDVEEFASHIGESVDELAPRTPHAATHRSPVAGTKARRAPGKSVKAKGRPTRSHRTLPKPRPAVPIETADGIPAQPAPASADRTPAEIRPEANGRAGADPQSASGARPLPAAAEVGSEPE